MQKSGAGRTKDLRDSKERTHKIKIEAEILLEKAGAS